MNSTSAARSFGAAKPGWRRRCRLLSAALAGVALAACAGPRQVLLQGDAKEAQVSFAGDLDGATAIARHHCAEYERVPHFVGVAEDVAYFDCVPRPRP